MKRKHNWFMRPGKAILIFVTLIIFMSQICPAQNYVHIKKDKAVKKFKRNVAKSLHVEIHETDSTISFLVRDTAFRYTDFILFFDSNGRCNKEETVFDCDFCFQKILRERLANHSYKWTKLSDAAYLSKRRKMLMLINNPGHQPFVIQHRPVNDRDYQYLLKKLHQEDSFSSLITKILRCLIA